MICPSGIAWSFCSVVSPRISPAACSAASASPRVIPVSDGTGTVLGPPESTRSTALPASTWRSAGGSCSRTRPSGTSSEARRLVSPRIRPAASSCCCACALRESGEIRHRDHLATAVVGEQREDEVRTRREQRHDHDRQERADPRLPRSAGLLVLRREDRRRLGTGDHLGRFAAGREQRRRHHLPAGPRALEVVGELLTGLVPVGRVLRQRPHHHGVELGRDLGVGRRRRRRCCVHLLVRDRHRRVAGERRPPGQHLVEDDAERVDVAPSRRPIVPAPARGRGRTRCRGRRTSAAPSPVR